MHKVGVVSMKLLFLGTSAGIPTKQRNVTGLALQESQGKGWYLIDCGEGTQHQLLQTPLSLNTLKAICITHVHGDHCYGLPGLLSSAAMHGRKHPLTIIAPRAIQHWIETTQQVTQFFLSFDIHWVSVEDLDAQSLGPVTIRSGELSHRVPSYAYQFTEAPAHRTLNIEKLQSWGIPRGPLWGQIAQQEDIEFNGQLFAADDFLMAEQPEQQVVVCGDNDTPERLRSLCQNAQVLVHESTYTAAVAAQVGAHVGHCDAQHIAEFAQSIGLPHLILTHFSSRYQTYHQAKHSIEDIRKEAKEYFDGQLVLAQDFLNLTLDSKGVLSVDTGSATDK